MRHMLMLIGLLILSVGISNADWCYQETANETSTHPSCSGLTTYNNGTYTFGSPGGWDDDIEHLMMDGDWTTGANAGDDANDNSFLVNYPVPDITGLQSVDTSNVIWQLKMTHGGSNQTLNFSLPSSCIGGHTPGIVALKWDLIVGNTPGSNDYARVRCFSAPTTQVNLFTSNQVLTKTLWGFEEAIYWNITSLVSPYPPNGTVSNPYKIDSCSYLYNNLTNQTAYYNLTTNLDCSSFMNVTKRSFFQSFSGVLNGNNHTIKNINLTPSASPNNAFIQVLDGGEVHDLHLDNVQVRAPVYGDISYNECGVVVGHLNSGIIDQVAITDSYVECGFGVGSLAGSINRNDKLTITNILSKNTTVFSTVCTGCDSGNYASGLISRSLGVGDAGNYSDIYTSVDVRLRTDCGCSTAKGFIHVQGTMNNKSDLYYEYPLANYSDSYAVAKSATELKNASESFLAGFDSGIWHLLDGYYPLLSWLPFPNFPPVIEILGVSFSDDNTYHSFDINGTDIEFHSGNWTFNVTITDIEGTVDSITIYNDTSTIFFGTDINNITLDYLSFVEFYQTYNISIISTDDRFNTSRESLLFTINDSIFPQCVGLDDEQVLNNSFYSWNIFCTDDSMYFFNLSCSNGISNFHQGLVPSHTYQDTRQITENVNCSYEACDGHTSQDVTLKVKKDKADTLTFDDVIDIKSKKATKYVDSIKKKDRYTFIFEYNQPQTVVEFEVPLECDYVLSPKYKGWFVCLGGKYWIDFESIDPKDKITVKGHTVIVKNPDGKEEFIFESIGKLNCIEGEQKITTYVPSRGTLGVNTCPEDLTNMIGLGIIVLIGLVLIIFGASNNAGGVGILGSIIMLFCGWILYGCFNMVGAVLSIGSLFLIIWFAVRKNPV